MRNLLILFFCLSFSGITIAQSGFSWGLNLYPNLSDRRLLNSGGRLSKKAISALDSLEKSVFGYAAGLDMQWQGETVGLNIGLRYRNAGYRTGITVVPPDDPKSDFANESEFRFTQTSIELPVEMVFFFNLDQGKALFFTMGPSFRYQLDAKHEVTYYRNSGAETQLVDPDYEYRSFNYAFQTGMGWQTRLNDNLIFSVQPNFQFWFKGIYEDRAEINRNLYNLGLKLGLRFFTSVE